jgi:hypothetical protein
MRAYATFDLELLPAQLSANRRLATMVGAAPSWGGASWLPVAGDSAEIEVTFNDTGLRIVLQWASGDSLHGHYNNFGVDTDPTVVRRVQARRRPSCAHLIPREAFPTTFRARRNDYSPLSVDPPLGVPAWLSDSLVANAPDGRSFVRNILLIDFQGGESQSRHAVVRALGGVVVGSLAPVNRDSVPTSNRIVMLYVENGASFAALQTVAERVQGNPLVANVGPWYRQRN